MNSAKYFALMVDESKDVSKVEQLSVVVRYYLSGTIYERFLGFHSAENLDSKSLLVYIKHTLSKCNIDIHNCIAQTYDGASVMSGTSNGVQTLVRNEVPQAIYVHCMNHRLNLVIVDVCKGVRSARCFFDVLEMLYVFLSGSATHVKFIAVQKQLGGVVLELQRICDTRWTSQIAACTAVKRTFPAVLVTLEALSGSESRGSRVAEARGIQGQLDNTFLFHLCLFSVILRELKVTSDYLQKIDCDIATSCMIIQANTDRLTEMRNSTEEFKCVWDECTKMAIDNGINMSVEARRPRKLPQHLAQFVVTEGVTGDYQLLQTEEEFRLHVYVLIIDKVIWEMNRRFNINSSVLRGVSSLHPQSKSFLDIAELKSLVEHYQCDMDSVEAEIKLLHKTIQRYETQRACVVNNLLEFVHFLEEFKIAFHEVYKLAVIAVTIPASSASCERTFSCMRRVKTYLRSRMANDRLSNLAVLAVERSIVKSLDMKDVVDKFDAAHGNRRINLH